MAKKEVELDELDAKRYQWLRQNWNSITAEVSNGGNTLKISAGEKWGTIPLEEIDRAIDEAIACEAKTKS